MRQPLVGLIVGLLGASSALPALVVRSRQVLLVDTSSAMLRTPG